MKRDDLVARAMLEANNEVKIIDDSEFEAGMCCNGGHYRFTTVYKRIGGGNTWTREYKTSAEFSYCSKHGGFMECNGCNEDYQCYEVVRTDQVLDDILSAMHSDAECAFYPGEKAYSIEFSK
jgi:hypothetical protein